MNTFDHHDEVKIKRVFQKSIQKTSVRSSHLSRYIVFQIPLIKFLGFQHSSSSTNVAWMKVFFPTLVSRICRGLNLHIQIYVRFVLAIGNLRHKIDMIHFRCRFPQNSKCYSSNHSHVVTDTVYRHGQKSFLDGRDASS